jgi:hypothetical protein
LQQWEDERKRRAPNVPISDKLWTALERAQPYHGRHPGLRPFLSAIRDLSNVDKHRRINVVAEGAANAGITLTLTGSDGPPVRIDGWRGPLVDKTEIANYVVIDESGAPVSEIDHAAVQVNGDLTLAIHFKNGWPGFSGSVIPFLNGACLHLENNIFRWLEPFL